MMTGAVLDILILVLLAATCGYCVTLSRRLKTVREGQAELLTAIAAFDDSTRRAAENLKAIEEAGLGRTRDLDSVVKRANTLVNELSIMVNAGDHIAGRIEGAIRDVRAIGGRRSGGEPMQ